MTAPLSLALEPVSSPRHRWPWAFWGHFGLGLWYGAGLWLLVAEPLFLRPWVVATALGGAWWGLWRGLRALGGRG